MKSLYVLIFTIFIAFTSQQIFASGQRTTTVTFDAINSYAEIDLSGKYAIEPVLHYIGTVNNKWHLLMVTKSDSSEDENGNISMPWSYVETYKASVKYITIDNGWDITNKLKKGGFEVFPASCPQLYISTKVKQYQIPKDENNMKSCLY